MTGSDLEEMTRQFLLSIRDRRGHDRCWDLYDELRGLAKIYGIDLDENPSLPPREEFEAGCRRYADEQYAAEARIKLTQERRDLPGQ